MSDWREIKSFKDIDWFQTLLNTIPMLCFLIGYFCGGEDTDYKLNEQCQKANNVYSCHVISIPDKKETQ